MDDVFLIISTLIFLVGFVLAVASLRRGEFGSSQVNLILAFVGLIFQSLFLRERGELHARCPITNGGEVLVFVSWSVVIFYLALGRAFRLSLLGVFSMPLVFLLQVTAIVILFTSDPGALRKEHSDAWLEVHAALSLMAYGAFGLAGIAGVMYLVQNRQLKSHQPGRLFYSLPPIRYLTDAMVRLVFIGTVVLTVGVVASLFMENFPDALHLIVSGAVWVVYLLILVIHWRRRLTPKQLSFSAMVAFAFALLTLSLL